MIPTSGSSVVVLPRHGRVIYAQREPRAMRRGWQDKAIEGDDHWGVIPPGTLILYIGSIRKLELVYDPKPPNHGLSTGQMCSRITNTYHLVLWRDKIVWLSNELVELERL